VIEERPEAVLLKVAHHGSATSTSADLLSTVHPRFAVISVGARNVTDIRGARCLTACNKRESQPFVQTKTEQSVLSRRKVRHAECRAHPVISAVSSSSSGGCLR